MESELSTHTGAEVPSIMISDYSPSGNHKVHNFDSNANNGDLKVISCSLNFPIKF